MSYIEHPNQDPIIVADANAEAAIGADIRTLFGLPETRAALWSQPCPGGTLPRRKAG
jgi:hypothetical protein